MKPHGAAMEALTSGSRCPTHRMPPLGHDSLLTCEASYEFSMLSNHVLIKEYFEFACEDKQLLNSYCRLDASNSQSSVSVII